MDKHIPEINGALLRMRREELGLALADLATRACLSKKQVKQIEEGGTSSFYSESVKVTAAKKIGGILGLEEQSVFVVDIPEPEVTEENGELSALHSTDTAAHLESSHGTQQDSPASEDTPAIHKRQDAEEEIASPAAKPYLKSASIETAVIQKSTNSALDVEEEPKSKNALWFIIALFVAALGLAAVMQKQPAPTQPVEPPPPILVLPPEQPVPSASAPVVLPAPVAPAAPSTASSSVPMTPPAQVVPAASPASNPP